MYWALRTWFLSNKYKWSGYGKSAAYDQKLTQNNSWEFIGNQNFTGGNAFSTTGALDNHDVPHMTFRDVNNGDGLTVMRYVNNAWEVIGGRSFNGSSVNPADIMFDNNNDIFVATRAFSSSFRVFKYDGVAWTQINVPNGADTAYLDMKVDEATGDVYVVSTAQTLYKYNGTDFDVVGTSNLDGLSSTVNDPTLELVNGDPYVSYSNNNTGNQLVSHRFNGATWETLPAVPNIHQGHDVDSAAFGNNYYVAVTRHFNPTAPVEIEVYEYNGSSWSQVGTDVETTQFTGEIETNNIGEIYVGYRDFNNSQQLTVKKLQEGQWNQLIQENPSGAIIENSMDIASNGDIYNFYRSGSSLNGNAIRMSEGFITFDNNEEQVVGDVEAEDADLDNLTWSISGGDDQNVLDINPNTGELSFVTSPSFDSPADFKSDNQYEVEVAVTDDTNTDTSDVVVIVNQAPGVLITPASHTVTEGDTSLFDISLITEPADDVTVNFTGLLPNTSLDNVTTTTNTISSVTFTQANYNSPQQIRINTAVNPASVLEMMSIQMTLSSSDGVYNGLAVDPINVSILDNTLTDQDGDNVDDILEQAAPNNGDGNNNGTLDFLQTDVSSIVNLQNEYITLASNNCTFDRVEVNPESVYGEDTDYDYEGGLVEFESPCATVNVEVLNHGGQGTLRKYNSNFFEIDGVVADTVVIDNANITRYSYTINDGDQLDTSLAGDGLIVDPIGFGQSVPGNEETDEAVAPSPETLIRTGGRD